MADEPTNPQQIIDEATKALGQAVVKPPKKKGGKGMLIGILLFLILTLPVAIYYGSQQITDIRSRAATTTTYRCQMPGEGLCTGSGMTIVNNTLCGSSCFSGKECCKITITVANTPTPPPTLCPKDCVSSQSQCKPGTQVGGVAYGDCGMGEYCCEKQGTSTLCPKDCVSSQSQCKSGTQVGGVGYGDCGMGEYCCEIATPQTTSCASRCSTIKGCQRANAWTNYGTSCEPVNSVKPITYAADCKCPSVSGGDNSACSGCAAATPTCPPYDPRLSPNCGCGEAFCGGCISACRHITNKTCQQLINEECNATPTTQPPSGQKMYYCVTNPYGCIQTTDSYTNESACATNVQLYGQKPNSGACYASKDECGTNCRAAGNFMYVCNTSTYQCTQTSSRYTSITACEAGND